MATTTDPSLDSSHLYHQLDNYAWDDDQEFQGGLRAILASTQDQAQLEHLTLRAKCYYYARKSGTKVDFDAYKRWVEGGRENGQSSRLAEAEQQPTVAQPVQPPQQADSGAMGNAPRPATFAEICELIAEGKPIPGIKDIPDTILEGQASESQATKRTKPWEKTGGEAQKPSWMK